jgi:hypothetical protein
VVLASLFLFRLSGPYSYVIASYCHDLYDTAHYCSCFYFYFVAIERTQQHLHHGWLRSSLSIFSYTVAASFYIAFSKLPMTLKASFFWVTSTVSCRKCETTSLIARTAVFLDILLLNETGHWWCS